jgi:hypothetical protein
VVRIDLLKTHLEDIPPEDYLHVYHTYFNEKASEEAYEMLDPASVQNITLGEWLSFYEPLWGERYVSLDNLRRISLNDNRATFAMERTFYDADGDPVPDPEVDASVVQEMIMAGGEWKLVMRTHAGGHHAGGHHAGDDGARVHPASVDYPRDGP